jgi:hypothetical protein
MRLDRRTFPKGCLRQKSVVYLSRGEARQAGTAGLGMSFRNRMFHKFYDYSLFNYETMFENNINS